MKKVTVDINPEIVDITECNDGKVYVFENGSGWVYKICYSDKGYSDTCLHKSALRYTDGYSKTLEDAIRKIINAGLSVYELDGIDELINFLQENK